MTNEQHDGSGEGSSDDTEAQQPFTPPVSSDPLQPTQLQPSTPFEESSTNTPSEPLSSSDHEMTTPLQSSPYSGQQPPQPPPPPPGYANPVQQEPVVSGGQAQGGYPPQGGYPGGPTPGGPGQPVQPNPSEKTNTLAIVSLVSAFFISILGIILGHIALSQIKKTGEGGRGLALAGTIIGYVITAIAVVSVVAVVVSTFVFIGATGSAFNEAAKELEGLEEIEDDYLSDEPWIGTAQENYCEALMNQELADDDAEQYYRELIPVTPNSDDAAVFEQALLFIEDPETMDDAEYDAFVNEIAEVNSRSTELCYEQ